MFMMVFVKESFCLRNHSVPLCVERWSCVEELCVDELFYLEQLF